MAKHEPDVIVDKAPIIARMLIHLEDKSKVDCALVASSILFHLNPDSITIGHIMDRLVTRIDGDFIKWIDLFLGQLTPKSFERFYRAKWVETLANHLIVMLRARDSTVWPILCRLAKLITLAELSVLLPQAEFELLVRLCMIEIRHALTNDSGEQLVSLLELCDQYLAVFIHEQFNQVKVSESC